MRRLRLERAGLRSAARLAACAGALALAACAAPMPPSSGRIAPDARAILDASARAHGRAAYARINDLNVSYEGEWFTIVQKVQPDLVDAGYRMRSEERLLPRRATVAQLHRGPRGTKYVLREGGGVQVVVDGRDATDAVGRDAAALVADGYRLFLLGPIFMEERLAALDLIGTAERDGRTYDLLLAVLRPGFGAAAQDKVLAYVDRADRRMRHVRFTLQGLASTQGAEAEVDLGDFIERGGLVVPTRFFERVLRPLPIDAHRWRMTGFDVDRGYGLDDLAGGLRGKAAPPAAPLR